MIHGDLFEGRFLEILNSKETGFNKKVCSFVNVHLKVNEEAADEEQYLSIANENEVKEKKANIPLFAGIAAGCLVVVAIVIIVVFVVNVERRFKTFQIQPKKEKITKYFFFFFNLDSLKFYKKTFKCIFLN